jgi:hypothetical protein
VLLAPPFGSVISLVTAQQPLRAVVSHSASPDALNE